MDMSTTKLTFWVGVAVLSILITGYTGQSLQNVQPSATQTNSYQQLQHDPVVVPSPSPPAIVPSFLMAIQDVFTIHGRGVVVTGRLERGSVKVNDPVEIVGIKPTKQTVVLGVEMFKKLLDEARAGDDVGLLLRGVERRDVERGQVIATPGSIKPHTKFKAKIDMLKKENGGRRTPFLTGYQPQFYLRTTDVKGVVELPSGIKMVRPGDKSIEVTVELTLPIALEEGLKFSIREAGRTVGTGTVTEMME